MGKIALFSLPGQKWREKISREWFVWKAREENCLKNEPNRNGLGSEDIFQNNNEEDFHF